MQLYKQYVRPHLEFAVQAWSLWLQADIDVLEKVQKWAVSMVSRLISRHYEARLKELGLTMPAERMRRQADPLNVRPNHGRLEIRCNAFSVRAGPRNTQAADSDGILRAVFRNRTI
jgi:hypothetical protein